MMELEDGYYASPRWSWEILDCAMPMTFDSYSNTSTPEHPIMRADGTYCRHDEVQVGDALMGWESGVWVPARVVAVVRHPSQIIEVKFVDGSHTISTETSELYVGDDRYVRARDTSHGVRFTKGPRVGDKQELATVGIASIRNLGEGDTISIETSTANLVQGDGVLAHNCAHQCVYCFAFFQRAIGGASDDYLAHRVKSVNVDKVKRMFSEPDKYAGQFAHYIKQRFVLQWGGMSDGFDWYERKFRKSLELLRFFKEIDYPISISTKGSWFLDDPDYREVLKDAKNMHWKYSIITADPIAAQKLEAGTSSPAERMLAMQKLNDLGVGATTLRFRPFVLGVSEKSIESLFREAKRIGCYSTTTEFLCLERRAGPNHLARYKAISEVVGYDVWDYYRKHSYSGSGLMRLNYEIKRPHIEHMKAVCAEIGLPFFVSDAHHKEASEGAGCCGLPSEGPLSNFNRGQYSEAMQLAKANGKVTWPEIASYAAWLKDVPFAAAEGYNQGSTLARAKNKYHSFFDFMHDMWNTPDSWQSPARYFGGVLIAGEKDENGDIVYLYNAPLVNDGVRVKSVMELRGIMQNFNEKAGVDGGMRGHVAYPVYVLAHEGEYTAAAAFDAERLAYTLVVPRLFESAISEALPHAQLLVADDDLATAAGADAKAEGQPRAWLVDGGAKGPFRPKLSAAEAGAEAPELCKMVAP